MKYQETETLESAIIKHEAGLQMVDNGMWMGSAKQWETAEDMQSLADLDLIDEISANDD